ncbi:MAG TPA: hypothetical protein VIJ20_08450 [Solirubrobacteraceae bacterium]
MSRFFIDTGTGQVATLRQLIDARLATGERIPELPWHRIQGSDDASTLWYAVLRKRVRGVHIGALAIRHQPHHASLLRDGWEEVSFEEIGVPDGWTAPSGGAGTAPTRR